MKSFSIGPALLAAGLLFCTLLVPLDVLADSKKDELSSKQSQAQQAYNEARQELEELQNRQSETQSQIDQLQGQSAEVAAQLSDIYTALQDAQRLLDERTAAAEQAAQALADKQAEYDASLARCKSQMGAMQLLDGGGSIALLLQARSLYEMLTFAETLRELAAHNSAALAQLNTEAEALAAARAEAHDAEVDRVQRQLGQDTGQNGRDAAGRVEQAGDKARQHTGRRGGQQRQPDRRTVEHHDNADRAASAKRAVDRQIGHIEDAVGQVDADCHNAPDKALGHRAGHRVDQGSKESHE